MSIRLSDILSNAYQGIQGVQGTQGIQGIQGLQGPQGVQGTQGIIGESYWTSTSAGINALSNTVGIGTTNPRFTLEVGSVGASGTSLYVNGNTVVTGNVSVAGTLTYEDVTNVDSIGLVTARAGAHVATTSGSLLVGSTTETGTASQRLQVTGGAYVSGSVGIGTTNPDKSLHIYTADGDVRIGDITEGTATTDAGIIFTGLGSNRSGLFTEVNGTLLSYGINCQQITGVETGRAGGVFRFDTRTSGPYNGSNCFTVVGKPIGTTTEYSAFVVGLNDGNAYLTPTRGNVLVGTATSTGTISQPLQVNGGAYVSGSVGIATTNPGSILAVGGTITELSQGQYWNVVTQADVGIGASQVPLNQYLGQLAFIDSYSPSGLRRDGGGSDDVVVNSSGNVGIGTTNPTSKLSLHSGYDVTLALTADTEPNIKLNTTDNSRNLTIFNSSGNFGITEYYNSQSNTIIYHSNSSGVSANQYTSFGVGGEERLRINGGGNILIGSATSTGTASQRLQVTGGAYVSTRIGVGQTNPNTALHIGPYNGNTLPHLYLASGNNLFGWRIDTQDFTAGSVPLRIFRRVNGVDTESVTVLNQNGNVGINSITPGSTLAVGGSITELSNNQYWNVVTQADVGIGASQIPLNQHLGQLAFLDEFGTNIPQNAQTSAYTLVRSDAGKHISITTGGVTVPAGVFEIGDVVLIYNNSINSQTITQGASVTLRQSGTANTGNRSLDAYGVATILCVASNTFVVYGTGVS